MKQPIGIITWVCKISSKMSHHFAAACLFWRADNFSRWCWKFENVNRRRTGLCMFFSPSAVVAAVAVTFVVVAAAASMLLGWMLLPPWTMLNFFAMLLLRFWRILLMVDSPWKGSLLFEVWQGLRDWYVLLGRTVVDNELGAAIVMVAVAIANCTWLCGRRWREGTVGNSDVIWRCRRDWKVNKQLILRTEELKQKI